ncbi:MAG: TetR/AcrR family transcriptional regulator [Pseudomonadota bacterium]
MHGGFYAHFPKRTVLIADAVESALDETRASLAAAVEGAGEGCGLDAFIDAYLDTRHRDHPERGCAGAALAPEIARGDDGVKASFTRGIEAIVALLARQLPPGESDRGRFETAYTIFSLLMGALELSRTTTDAQWSSRLLAEAREQALRLASVSAHASAG